MKDVIMITIIVGLLIYTLVQDMRYNDLQDRYFRLLKKHLMKRGD